MVVLGLLIAYVPLAALQGLVVRSLWGWFAVPVFGVGAITLAQAVGVALLLSAIRPREWNPGAESEVVERVAASVIQRVAASVIQLLFAWGVGAVVHHFFI